MPANNCKTVGGGGILNKILSNVIYIYMYGPQTLTVPFYPKKLCNYTVILCYLSKQALDRNLCTSTPWFIYIFRTRCYIVTRCTTW